MRRGEFLINEEHEKHGEETADTGKGAKGVV